MEEKVNEYPYPYHWSLSGFFAEKYRRPLDFFLDRVRPEDRVLDVGCGDGRMVHFLAGRSGHVFGVDVQERPLKMARLLLEGDAGVELQAYDGKRLPFEDASFDLVTCFDVIEHVPVEAVGAFVIELRRVMKPGGRLVLTTPNVRELRGRIWGHKVNGKHYQEFTVSGLREALEKGGLDVTDVRGIYLPVPLPKAEHFASTVPFRPLFSWLIRAGEGFPELADGIYVGAVRKQ